VRPDTVNGPEASAAAKQSSPSASRVIRRTHLYLGLFLAPWMLMYALSTLLMTRRDFVLSFYPARIPAMTVERELDYTRSFPANATPQQIGRGILEDLGLDGAHRLSGGTEGKPLVIDRLRSLGTKRIVFTPGNGKLTLEREEFRSLTFLERLHRRRGYQQPYAVEDAWAFTVDLAAIAMVLWALSGLWMWWELKPTRRWGAACLGFSAILFAVFAVAI
jgi:hypothetical protein